MWPAFLHPARDWLAARCQRAGNPPWKLAWSLVWSVYLFSTPLFSSVDPAFWWSIVLSYPLFLLLFVALHLRPYDETSIYVAALTLLGCVTMLWNLSAWTYAVFACCYVPYEGSLRASMSRMVLIVALLLLEAWLLHWPWAIMAVMAIVSISAGAGTLVARANVFKDSALRMSHDEVRRLAATAERERIGRDLHDLLGHTLSLIALKSELARKLFDRDPAAAQREIGEVERVARHALAQVRAAVTGIRVSGLAAELASARLLLQTSNVHFEYRQHAGGLPADVEHDLALVLREAVTNIHRRARATLAEARVAREGDERWKPGPRPTRSTTASARSCVWPARANRPATSPPS